MYCPNPDCPDFRLTGTPGEYRAEVTHCPACSSRLTQTKPVFDAPHADREDAATTRESDASPAPPTGPVLCPRCEVEMQAKPCFTVTLDQCANCDSVWLDGREMQRLVDHAAGGRGQTPDMSREVLDDVGLSCPRCARQPLCLIKVESLAAYHCKSCLGLLVDWKTINAVTERCSAWPVEDESGGGGGTKEADVISGGVEVLLLLLRLFS